MKKLLFWAYISSLALLTSCGDSLLVEEKEQAEVSNIDAHQIPPITSLNAVLGEDVSTAATKVTYSEETESSNTSLVTYWAVDDALSVTSDPSSSAAKVFTISSGVGRRNGTFISESTITETSKTWVIYHPSSVKSDEDYDSFSFDGQIQVGNDNTDHLSQYHLMRKEYTFSDNQPVPTEISLSGDGFTQASCIKVVAQNLPESITPVKLKFEIYGFSKVAYAYNAREVSKDYYLSQELDLQNFSATDNITAYMMLPVMDLTVGGGKYFKITITGSDGTEYYSERLPASAQVLESGKYHRISISKLWVKNSGIDGTYSVLQTATNTDIKTNYCNVIIMGDGFVEEDYNNGTFDSWAQKAYEALFSTQPFTGLKDLFNVYSMRIVSPQRFNLVEITFNGAQNADTNTALGVEFEPNSTHMQNTDIHKDKIMNYVQQIEGLSLYQAGCALIIVIANVETHAGTCSISYYMGDSSRGYSTLNSIAFVALGNKGSSQDESFKETVIHEAGGHGFGKLADEYTSSSYYADLSSAWNVLANMHLYGLYRNVDKYEGGVTTTETVYWSSFIGNPNFSDENIGVYEGAYAVESGFCRPTENSVMRSNSLNFNAPSRYEIYYRAMRLIGKTDEEASSSFATWDAAHKPNFVAESHAPLRNAGVKSSSGLLPLAPPDLICVDY